MRAMPAVAFGLTLVLAASPAIARQEPGEICDLAAQKAAATYQVPEQILMAVARVETGRQSGAELRPWPWAVNLGGEGHWAADVDEAMQIAQSALDEGRLNIDIGCFQLNIRWHSKGFMSLADMFDPQTNADYAAGFLLQLYRETGDWQTAVGTYHSRNAELAGAYADRVAAVAQQTEPLPSETGVTRRANLFPLLQSGGPARAGSLFPQPQTIVSPLIGKGS